LAGVYLKNVLQLPSDKKVFVIGMEGIKDELNGLDIDNYSLEVSTKIFALLYY
jgi:4-nitrophenyl phosphatase